MQPVPMLMKEIGLLAIQVADRRRSVPPSEAVGALRAAGFNALFKRLAAIDRGSLVSKAGAAAFDSASMKEAEA